MDTFQLTCFLSLADSLNFARSAEELHVTQPTVTRQIRALEEELGTKLFHRSTRFVALTEDGHSFLRDAKNIIRIAAYSKKRFEREDEEVTQLSIGCFSTVQTDWLPEILFEMNQCCTRFYPHVEVIELKQIFYLMEQGGLDVILGIRMDMPRNRAYRYRELVQCPLVCCVREDSPLLEAEAVTLARLAEEPVIFYDVSFAIPQIAEVQQRIRKLKNRTGAEDETPEGIMRFSEGIHFCESMQTAMMFAEAGLGVAIVPELFITRDTALCSVPLADAPTVSLGLYDRADNDNPALKIFRGLLMKKLS